MNNEEIENLKHMDPVQRIRQILQINVLELLEPSEEGVNLNEGYNFDIDGSIPQLADGIAKMALEMDKDKDFGTNGGGAFITLIEQYYQKLKAGE